MTNLLSVGKMKIKVDMNNIGHNMYCTGLTFRGCVLSISEKKIPNITTFHISCIIIFLSLSLSL